MKFPYLKLESATYRPIVRCGISYNGGMPVEYYGLIDSGADHTVISEEVGKSIGIQDIKAGRETLAASVSGYSSVYFHPVTITIGGHNFDIEAGFAVQSTLLALGYVLIGQIGLFDQCSVIFDRRQFEMEINPHLHG